MAAFAHSNNSTNVRIDGSVAADGLVEDIAVARFKTPRRATHDLPSPVFVDGAGQRLATWSWGSGPTVLLVHGWNGHASQLRSFVPPLIDAGYRVVAFDQPAHGMSTGERAHVVDFANAVDAVGKRERPSAIIAHSLGATGAALAIARGLPVKKAALLAPPAEVPYFALGAAKMMGLGPAQAKQMLARVRDELGDLDALDLRKVAIPAKLFVMHDPEDREVPFEHGRTIAEHADAIFDAPFGAGHRGMLRDPQLVARIVDFIVA